MLSAVPNPFPSAQPEAPDTSKTNAKDSGATNASAGALQARGENNGVVPCSQEDPSASPVVDHDTLPDTENANGNKGVDAAAPSADASKKKVRVMEPNPNSITARCVLAGLLIPFKN